MYFMEIRPELSFLCGNVGIAIQSTIVGLIVTYIVSIGYEKFQRVKAPRVGKNPWIFGLARAQADFFKNGNHLTKEGYARYKDSMYWIQTGDMGRLVLSDRYLNELRRLPNI